jgi:hypothetical protein
MDPLYVILIGIILIGLVFLAISIAEDRKEKTLLDFNIWDTPYFYNTTFC